MNLNTGTALSTALMWLASIGLGGCPVGCGSLPKMGDKEFDRTLRMVKEVRDVAKENGTSWKVSIVSNGAPGIGEKAELFFDTGIQFEAHFQGNAQNAASETDPVGPPPDVDAAPVGPPPDVAGGGR